MRILYCLRPSQSYQGKGKQSYLLVCLKFFGSRRDVFFSLLNFYQYVVKRKVKKMVWVLNIHEQAFYRDRARVQ